MMERMPPGVDQFLVLFDFSEWGLRNYDKSATDRLVSVLQNHFPETLFKVGHGRRTRTACFLTYSRAVLSSALS